MRTININFPGWSTMLLETIPVSFSMLNIRHFKRNNHNLISFCQVENSQKLWDTTLTANDTFNKYFSNLLLIRLKTKI